MLDSARTADKVGDATAADALRKESRAHNARKLDIAKRGGGAVASDVRFQNDVAAGRPMRDAKAKLRSRIRAANHRWQKEHVVDRRRSVRLAMSCGMLNMTAWEPMRRMTLSWLTVP